MKLEHDNVDSARNALHVGNDGADSTARGRASGRLNLIARSAKDPATSPERVARGRHENGYRYGPGRFTKSPSLPEANLAILVPGESSAAAGFEVLDQDGVLVAWFACPIDACDRLKAHKGAGKIVRCADRALIKSRMPDRGRL